MWTICKRITKEYTSFIGSGLSQLTSFFIDKIGVRLRRKVEVNIRGDKYERQKEIGTLD